MQFTVQEYSYLSVGTRVSGFRLQSSMFKRRIRPRLQGRGVGWWGLAIELAELFRVYRFVCADDARRETQTKIRSGRFSIQAFKLIELTMYPRS